MKRTPLYRYTRLARSAMPPRRTPLKRSTAKLRLRPATSPQERTARELVRRRSGGICEAWAGSWCTGGAGPLNFHHRKNRSQGGQWSASNGMAVCGSGSTGCHGWITEHPRGAAAKGWTVPSALDPARVMVTYRRAGLVILAEDGSLLPQWIGGVR